MGIKSIVSKLAEPPKFTLHRVINYFALFPVNYSPLRKEMFQIKLSDLNETYILYYAPVSCTMNHIWKNRQRCICASFNVTQYWTDTNQQIRPINFSVDYFLSNTVFNEICSVVLDNNGQTSSPLHQFSLTLCAKNSENIECHFYWIQLY
jgi:hypothetical protein